MKEYNQLSIEEQIALHNSFLRDPDPFYEMAETSLLKDALKSSYKERFLMMTRLMKVGSMLSKAKKTFKHYSTPNTD